jgi:hypothetical protein
LRHPRKLQAWSALAKLSVKTVQFGPARHSFQAYAVSIKPMNSR